MASSITSANAVLTLAVVGLYDVPQQIKGFSAEDIYSADVVEMAETAMGVDGYFTGGFVFAAQPQTISLMADSPSNAFFEQWIAANRKLVDIYKANGTILLRSIGRKYSMTDGILTRAPGLVEAGKTLKRRSYTITWGRVEPQPI